MCRQGIGLGMAEGSCKRISLLRDRLAGYRFLYMYIVFPMACWRRFLFEGTRRKQSMPQKDPFQHGADSATLFARSRSNGRFSVIDIPEKRGRCQRNQATNQRCIFGMPLGGLQEAALQAYAKARVTRPAGQRSIVQAEKSCNATLESFGRCPGSVLICRLSALRYERCSSVSFLLELSHVPKLLATGTLGKTAGMWRQGGRADQRASTSHDRGVIPVHSRQMNTTACPQNLVLVNWVAALEAFWARDHDGKTYAFAKKSKKSCKYTYPFTDADTDTNT